LSLKTLKNYFTTPFSLKSRKASHSQWVSMFTTVLDLSDNTIIISDITTEIGLWRHNFESCEEP